MQEIHKNALLEVFAAREGNFDDEELLCYSSFFQVSSHRHNWREESYLGFDSVSQAVPLRHENQN